LLFGNTPEGGSSLGGVLIDAKVCKHMGLDYRAPDAVSEAKLRRQSILCHSVYLSPRTPSSSLNRQPGSSLQAGRVLAKTQQERLPYKLYGKYAGKKDLHYFVQICTSNAVQNGTTRRSLTSGEYLKERFQTGEYAGVILNKISITIAWQGTSTN
jgi:hypothetical protein